MMMKEYERIIVGGVEEAATKQEGRGKKEDQNRDPTAQWPGCFLFYLFCINDWPARRCRLTRLDSIIRL